MFKTVLYVLYVFQILYFVLFVFAENYTFSDLGRGFLVWKNTRIPLQSVRMEIMIFFSNGSLKKLSE